MADTYTFSFRKDIQGLRGLAVLLVVLYHAGLPLHGGFVGVDVFFVISGFVITGGMLHKLSESRFSFREFYRRRVRRLLPTLSLVITATVLAGIFLGPIATQKVTGRTAVAAVFWNANHYLYRSSGYFRPITEFNSLLHTWSLSVEEQFYLVFPILIFFLFRRRTSGFRTIGWGIAAFGLVSFGLSQVMTYSSDVLGFDGPKLAFYTSISRSWEFALGALVAVGASRLRESKLSRPIVGQIGLAAILASCFFINPTTPFPGVAALLPTVGTILLIVSGLSDRGGVVSAIMNHRGMVRLGDLSYSWYLWHWPLMVFGMACFPDHILVAKITGGVVSLGLAIATERWFETPIRYRDRADEWPLWVIIALSCVAPVAAWGVQVASTSKLEENEYVASVFSTEREYLELGCDSSSVFTDVGESCRMEGDSKLRMVLIGDSNARHHIPAVRTIAEEHNASLYISTLSSCPFVPDLPRSKGTELTACHQWVEQSMAALIRERPTVVVISGAWDRYSTNDHMQFVDVSTNETASDTNSRRDAITRGLAEFSQTLEENGSSVFLVDPIPKFHLADGARDGLELHHPVLENQGGCSLASFVFWPEKCFLHRELDSPKWTSATEGTKIHEDAVAISGARRIDVSSALCPDDRCATGEGTVLYYVNSGHISPDGSRLTVGIFREALKPVLSSQRSNREAR